ncbi:MAG: lysine--tRNA ligase [Acidobacteriia bacterium]|nr:lysine--tRNA ligase [Terriglobia bacterium]
MTESTPPTASDIDQIAQRKKKLEQIIALGHSPYPSKFEWTTTASTLLKEYSASTKEQLETQKIPVRLAGRLMTIRGHGKAAFAHLSDGAQRIQIYVRLDSVGEENFKLFQLLDVGDLIGASGYLFRTKTNELTVHVDQLTFLAKAMRPLPEKWHGLTDVEARYRQRYLDLIVNPEVRETFVRRSQIIRFIRDFFDARGYIEVETPMMQPLAGGALARPFVTHHNTLDMDLYLRIAPELYLKRLIVGGLNRVYEINRNFRNEGISTRHNPEFTMLEFYQAYSDYRELMDLTEELLRSVVREIVGGNIVEFDGQSISFEKFDRWTMRGAVVRFWRDSKSPPSVESLQTLEGLQAAAKSHNAAAAATSSPRVEAGPDSSPGQLLGALFEAVAEKELIQPTFIYEFPVELSPLSKRNAEHPAMVDRFELFIAGMEIANAFSELNDPADQKDRFEQQLRMREGGDEEAHQMDEDYIRALSYGMPPTAGEGIGIDRITMLLTNSKSIRDVILFPLMRPEKPAADS